MCFASFFLSTSCEYKIVHKTKKHGKLTASYHQMYGKEGISEEMRSSILEEMQQLEKEIRELKDPKQFLF